MALKLYQVDAFTDRVFGGNPAAVCILTEPRQDTWMQSLAQEMNLSETAFLLKEQDDYGLRWFTPAVEVDLCGHATLASAHVLWETGMLAPDELARFHTRSGLLTAGRRGDWIEMDFPEEPPEAADAPLELVKALELPPRWIGRNRRDYFVEVDSEEVVRKMRPDFALLATIPVLGTIVTSRSESREYDFVSRFFAPRAGINEDPVTGSAHCALSPYWSRRLDRTELVGYQASARGGVVRVSHRSPRVILGGQAITVLTGELAA
ncbi:MAG: PhzF family phenazine biosynthesis protein [Acidobacteriota bacterium]